MLILSFAGSAQASEVFVPKGLYQPVFREPKETDISVGPLWVDQVPVTNKKFLEFIKKNPQFSKSKVKSLFADAGYLPRWHQASSFPKGEAHYPVVGVSWFVARRYCEFQGKRLPSIAEWELASDARDTKNEAKILEWYSKPNLSLRNVGQSPKNKFGLNDMHNLVWEWVDNFSETIMSADSRGGSDKANLFCGGASLKAKDPSLYAAFIRFAFRSSLNAKYTSTNLGFRCIRSAEGDSP